MLVTVLLWWIAIRAAWGYSRLLPGRRMFFGAPPALSEPVEIRAADLFGGLLMPCALLLAISLAAPLAWWIGLIVLAPGLWMSRNSRLDARWLLMTLPVALFVSTRNVSFYDTALYHQQAVKWMSAFGLVRGLALLNYRLGYVSSWFAFAAPVNAGALAGRVPAILGGLVFAGMLATAGAAAIECFSAENSPRERRSARALTSALFCGLLLVIAIVWDLEASLSTDLIVWLAPLMAAIVLTDDSIPLEDRIGKATLFAALACLVKLTALAVLGYLLVLLALAFRREHNRGRLAKWLAASAALGVLLIGANFKVSGCPAFPSPFGCLATEWSVGSAAARAIQADTDQYSQAANHPAEIIPFAVAAIAGTAAALWKRRGEPFVRHGLAASWIGIVFVAFAAPSRRFALGYFLLPVAMGAACVILDWFALDSFAPGRFAQQSFASRKFAGISQSLDRTGGILRAHPRFAVAGVWIAATVVAGAGVQSPDDLLYPRRMASAAGDPIHVVNRNWNYRDKLSLERIRHAGLETWRPTASDQCWDARLFCTAQLTVEKAGLRDPGAGPRGGFVQR